MLNHGAVIAGDIRLTLGTVYKHCLNGAVSDSVKLRPDRESRAAEADDAAVTHGGKELVKIMHFGRFHGGVCFHLAVALNADGDGIAVGLNRLDGAGDAGVDRHGILTVLAGDELAYIDVLTDLDRRCRRSAGVHVHG